MLTRSCSSSIAAATSLDTLREPLIELGGRTFLFTEEVRLLQPVSPTMRQPARECTRYLGITALTSEVAHPACHDKSIRAVP